MSLYLRLPNQSGDNAGPLPTLNRLWPGLLLLAIIALVTYVRLRLLQMPLERDEGEYAYAGQLLLQGVPPYQEFYSMKWPGTFGAYALIMALFGQTIGGIHFGLLLVNIATIVLVFLLGRRLAGDLAGVVAAGTYAVLSLSPFALGLAAHATHFVVLPAVAGLLLLSEPFKTAKDDPAAVFDPRHPSRVTRHIFYAGLLLGLAALMKQSGIAFGLFAALCLLQQERAAAKQDWRRSALRLGCLAAGGLLPLALTFAITAVCGTFSRFWLWTFDYSGAYGQLVKPLDAGRLFISSFGELFRGARGLWALAAIGLILLFVEPWFQRARFFVLGFFLCSLAALCTGWYFRSHYYMQILPAVGLLAGIAVEDAARLLKSQAFGKSGAPSDGPKGAAWILPLLAFLLAAGWSLYISRATFFQRGSNTVSRAIYGSNPFPEAMLIGDYLKDRCSMNGRVAVLGSEPEIFFYSHRRSATGYVYTYPLMEQQPFSHAMQEEMIQQIVAANPEYVIFVNVPASWLALPDSDGTIFEWFNRYREEHLQLVGLVETMPDYHIECTWNVPPEGLTPRTDRYLQIFKRK
jgi:hypothetical protein